VRRLRGHPHQVAIHVSARGQPSELDLRRVEVATPEGLIVELTAVRWGEFVGRIDVGLGHAGSLRIVGVDQALNQAALDVVLR
ncbi:MAG: hypothetical protein JWN04_1524, partial [Myxococcaceae bacterium]|nr:hypothetical protein [Myxococcaceae bacterium]